MIMRLGLALAILLVAVLMPSFGVAGFTSGLALLSLFIAIGLRRMLVILRFAGAVMLLLLLLGIIGFTLSQPTG
jgi:hypothetical protein